MKERLKSFRKSQGLTQGQFGERIGMTDAAISHMESGRTAISEQNIKLICLTFGVCEKWLRAGTGDMLNDEAALSGYEKNLLGFFRDLSSKARRMLVEYAEKLVSDERELRGDQPEAGEKTG
jgi:transcriptional regulator with XRE-family HTH domain